MWLCEDLIVVECIDFEVGVVLLCNIIIVKGMYVGLVVFIEFCLVVDNMYSIVFIVFFDD